MNWSRGGQTDPMFSQAKADAVAARAAEKAARAKDEKAAKERLKAEKKAKKKGTSFADKA